MEEGIRKIFTHALWGGEGHLVVGRELVLPALFGRRFVAARCLDIHIGLCMSPGGDSLVETSPIPEVGGAAQYQPFKKGPMQGHHVLPINELN